MRPRCDLCGGRLYSDESQLAHEFSGRCAAHQRFSQPGAFHYGTAPVGEKRNPRSWGAGTQRGKVVDRPEPAHGTRSRYTSPKWKCRCALCKRATADYSLARKKAART